MSNVIDVIQKRSSTRGYTPEPLTEEERNTLLHSGSFPSDKDSKILFFRGGISL